LLTPHPLFHPVNPVNPVKIQFFNCIVGLGLFCSTNKERFVMILLWLPQKLRESAGQAVSP